MFNTAKYKSRNLYKAAANDTLNRLHELLRQNHFQQETYLLSHIQAAPSGNKYGSWLDYKYNEIINSPDSYTKVAVLYNTHFTLSAVILDDYDGSPVFNEYVLRQVKKAYELAISKLNLAD